MTFVEIKNTITNTNSSLAQNIQNTTRILFQYTAHLISNRWWKF